MSNQTQPCLVKELKKARKTLKFWFKVLLGTNLMDDPNHRQEYQNALDIVQNSTKKIKSGI